MRTFEKARTGLLALALLISLFAPQPAQAAVVPYWNVAYTDRQPVAIKTVDAIPAGYSMELTLNHSAMVTATKSLASGNDLRIVYWNGTTNVEIDRILAVGSGWNSTKTTLFFKTQAAIAASTTDLSYYLYSGNSSAGTPPANGDNVYELYDDFSGGTFNTAKWTKFDNDGISVSQTGGELVVSGTNFTANGYHSRGFYPTNPGHFLNYTSEVNFRIVNQSSAAAATFEGQLGSCEGYAATGPNRVEWYDGWFNYGTNQWQPIGTSTYSGTSTPYHRVKTTVNNTTLSYFEDGDLKGSRSGLSGYSDTDGICFFYATKQTNQTFEVRFDDIVVKKFSDNPPTAVLTSSKDLTFSAVITPMMSFTLAARSTACNSATPTAGTTSGAAAISFGTLAPGSAIVAQELSVSSNARLGHTVYVRSSGTFASGNATIADLGFTNAAPGAFSAGSTGALGYTTDATLGTGTANRFSSGGTKWAGLSATSSEVAFLNGPSAGAVTCVAYRAGTTALTPAGSYATNLIYTAVPIF